MCSYIDNVRFQYFLAAALSSHGCPLLTGISVHCSAGGWSYTLEERGRGCRRRARQCGVHTVRWEQSSGRGEGGPVRGEAGRASRKRHASRAEEDRHGQRPSGRVGRRQGVAEGGQQRRPEAMTCGVAGRG
jgi:hypothetical protein